MAFDHALPRRLARWVAAEPDWDLVYREQLPRVYNFFRRLKAEKASERREFHSLKKLLPVAAAVVVVAALFAVPSVPAPAAGAIPRGHLRRRASRAQALRSRRRSST